MVDGDGEQSRVSICGLHRSRRTHTWHPILSQRDHSYFVRVAFQLERLTTKLHQAFFTKNLYVWDEALDRCCAWRCGLSQPIVRETSKARTSPVNNTVSFRENSGLIGTIYRCNYLKGPAQTLALPVHSQLCKLLKSLL